MDLAYRFRMSYSTLLSKYFWEVKMVLLKASVSVLFLSYVLPSRLPSFCILVDLPLSLVEVGLMVFERFSIYRP